VDAVTGHVQTLTNRPTRSERRTCRNHKGTGRVNSPAF
jgi:hypothetical protein